MDIQWPLALFTLFSAMGGCLFVFVGLNEFTKKSKVEGFVPGLVAIILAIVGGLCSVLHLEHVDRIMNALSHPTSGIFIEAVLIGCLVICVAAYLLCLKRSIAAGVKVFAVLGIVFGLALSFMAGHSYMMNAVATWNTILLPVGYLFTALPMGAALYWALAGQERDAGIFMAKCTIVSGILALIGSVCYAVASGAFFGGTAVVAILAIILSGVVPAAIGYLVFGRYLGKAPLGAAPATKAQEPSAGSDVTEAGSEEAKAAEASATADADAPAADAAEAEQDGEAGSKHDETKTEIWVAFGSAAIGALLYRVLMWMMFVPLYGFFGQNF